MIVSLASYLPCRWKPVQHEPWSPSTQAETPSPSFGHHSWERTCEGAVCCLVKNRSNCFLPSDEPPEVCFSKRIPAPQKRSGCLDSAGLTIRRGDRTTHGYARGNQRSSSAPRNLRLFLQSRDIADHSLRRKTGSPNASYPSHRVRLQGSAVEEEAAILLRVYISPGESRARPKKAR